MTLIETANALLRAGIGSIPVRADKVAAIKWKDYETRLPTEAELFDWFELERPHGIALVAGRVQCLDFDEKYSAGIFHRFQVRAEETGLGGVVRELLRQQTPTGGFHLVWECSGPTIGNTKLARKENKECMIETRGLGGYFLIAPSPGYTLEAGSFADIPKISTDDRDALLDLARTFDELATLTEAGPAPQTGQAETGISPADDFDRRADVPALLRKHGWRPAGHSDKYWTRPGKARGVSATWGVIPGRFYVFSSSTDLEQGHVYRPAWLYAALECGGDFARAASELRRQGFGGFRPKSAKSFKDYLAEAEEPTGMAVGQDHPEPSPIEGIDPAGHAPTTETEDDKIRRLLNARKFDPNREPPPIRPIFKIGESIVSTPGNLTAVVAPAKVGKSALVSAMAAASMTKDASEVDLLGVTGWNEHGRGLLYIDTEQAPDDFWHSVNRARKRARTDIMPAWLHAFTVADLPAPVARKAVAIKMADLAEEFGGMFVVILDGVADLVLDVNDATECNALVAELHGLAIRYDCALVLVLHLNPGSEKARGHLGSQIERKAESNLKIEKDQTVSVVWSNKQRRAPIDKATGPRFAWSDDQKMHVTVAGDDTGLTLKDQDKLIEYYDLAVSAFKERPVLRWSELYSALQESRKTPDHTPAKTTVERWIKVMRQKNIIKVFQGNYTLTLPQPPGDGQNGGSLDAGVKS